MKWPSKSLGCTYAYAVFFGQKHFLMKTKREIMAATKKAIGKKDIPKLSITVLESIS